MTISALKFFRLQRFSLRVIALPLAVTMGVLILTALDLFPADAQQNPAAGADRQSQPVSVRIVVDSEQVSAGSVITPGVRFHIPENWHIYGQTPGKIGLPTKVKYTVPPGFTVGDLHWPPHKSFEQPGGFTGYGYDQEVTLAAPVQVPDKLPPGEKFEIEAEVRWLSCYDRCIPGHAKLSQEFTIAAQ